MRFATILMILSLIPLCLNCQNKTDFSLCHNQVYTEIAKGLDNKFQGDFCLILFSVKESKVIKSSIRSYLNNDCNTGYLGKIFEDLANSKTLINCTKENRNVIPVRLIKGDPKGDTYSIEMEIVEEVMQYYRNKNYHVWPIFEANIYFNDNWFDEMPDLH